MNSAGDIGLQKEPIACPQCGSASRVGRGLCLNCLLYRGLGEETFDNETLESVLQEVDVRDAEWRLGNYQILEEIGRGGMGVIYRARQRHSRRIVALKRILTHHSESHDTLVRFRREAEAAASLDHPNILPIYEVSESEDGLPFFSMKFAVGGSLVGNRAALHVEIRRAVGLTAKVARAVEYAHSRGILHRDLKPGNILLDGRGEPLVSDFGLAKWLDESSDLTRTLTIFGTPGYIAPEQTHGPASGLKATADIYSLGAVLFDLIAGRPPFLGEHALSVLQQAAEKPAPKLRSLIPKIDRDLETICARCLERDPPARYQRAGDLAADLERWIQGWPVVARPVPPAVRIWRWTKRNPKLAASVAGCALAGVTALAFVTFTFLPNTSPFRPRLAISEKSIAVLPFENLSDDKQNSYFADGVQDEILTDLAMVADLKVISRTSAMQYKNAAQRNLREIANALGVAHVLEGSVQRTGNRVRVRAELIDARTDTHLWAERYDRDLVDVFAIQSEIAKTIADQLQAKISPSEKAAIEKPPTADLIAYDLYLRAQTLFADTSDPIHARQKLPQATKLLDEAVARDPRFLQALCLLSRVHSVAYFRGHDHTPARLALANAALEAAQRVQPDAGEVHLALANFYYHAFRDYGRARAELSIAQRTLPNNADAFLYTGFIDRREGHWEGATRNMERALELDPRNFFILQQLALIYQWQHRYVDEARTYDRALTIVPANANSRICRALVALDSRADISPFQITLATLVAEDPSVAPDVDLPLYALCERTSDAAMQALANYPREGVANNGVTFPHEYWEGVMARYQGNSSRARTAFAAARKEVEETVKHQPDFAAAVSLLGMIDAGLDRREDAIREGRRGCELLPISKDAIDGTDIAINMAQIYAWVGDKDRAIEQIEMVGRVPNTLSYGLLKLHPYWDSLRGDLRFQKILTSLAPK
jgi:TolB-like protein/tRNA A-37 threonylcarbamoyl transferase component Bud32